MCIYAGAALAGCPDARGPLGADDGAFDPAGAPPEASARVTEETLPNGLRLITFAEDSRRETAPGAVLLVPFDPAAEPVGLEGASGVMVRLAIAGTDRDTEHGSPRGRALALGATLEPIDDGAALGWVASGVGAPSPVDPSQLLGVVLDVAIAPELPGTALATDADRWRARLESDPDVATQAAMRWAVALALGFGRPVGTEPTALALGEIHREAVIRIHRRLVRPERAVVVMTGPPSEAMRARLAAWRADSMQGTPPDWPCAAPRPRDPSDTAPHEGATYALRAPDEHAFVRARAVPGVADRGRAAWDALLARAALLPPPVGFGVALHDVGEHGAALIRWCTKEAPETEAAWQAWLASLATSFARTPARVAAARTPLAVARVGLWPTTHEGVGATLDERPVLTALAAEGWSATLVVTDVPPPGTPTIGRDRALCPLPAPTPD